MRIAFKLAMDLSKSEVRALRRAGIMYGLDTDDPAGRVLIKRVLAHVLNAGLGSIYAGSPFEVTPWSQEPVEAINAAGYVGPTGSAPVEDETEFPALPRRSRRSRSDAAGGAAS